MRMLTVAQVQTRSVALTAKEPSTSHFHLAYLNLECFLSSPEDFFRCDELIKKASGLAETLTLITLIGTGGVGKTSVALTVLHHDCIKKRFGDIAGLSAATNSLPPVHQGTLELFFTFYTS